MARRENPVKDDIDMKEPLNTNGELDLKNSSLKPQTHSRMSKFRALLKKKLDCSTVIAIILVLLIALLVSVSFNIIQYGYRTNTTSEITRESNQVQLSSRQMGSTVWSLFFPTVKLKELQTTPASLCPSNWTMNGERCYFFSVTQQTWDFSQSYCSSYGGSLLTNHSSEEWAFIMKHRRPAEIWLNLKRSNLNEPWKWPNGSLVDSQISGEGLCAYINQRAASSTLCDQDRYWICSKPISHT